MLVGLGWVVHCSYTAGIVHTVYVLLLHGLLCSLKACPHRSIEVRLRLPGVDLWTSHKPAWYEVMLQFMLLGAVYLHR